MRKLEEPVTISGKVIPGEKVGRKIGFPTANIDASQQRLKIRKGVYLSQCQIDNKKRFGMTYFGPRYIFNEKKDSFEIFIFNFNRNIYGKKIEVILTHFMRNPVRVKSMLELQKLLEDDREKGLIKLKKIK